MPDEVYAPEPGESLEQIYRTHKARLHRLVRQRLPDPSQAEDVTHEAFTRLAARSDLLAAENPLALLTRIAINIIRDGLRTERYRDEREPALRAHFTTVHHTPDPERHTADRQELVHLRDAIERLPPRCREVFIMHKIHGQPHSDVARTLGISRNMVEKHLIRAYRQLRECRDGSETGND